MSDIDRVMARIEAAANDPVPDGAAWCSEPRIYPPGCPEAQKLRDEFGVPIGGRRQNRTGQPKSDDVNENLLREMRRRNEAARLEREAKARRAWELVSGGMSINAASAEVGVHHKTLRAYWARMGLGEATL